MSNIILRFYKNQENIIYLKKILGEEFDEKKFQIDKIPKMNEFYSQNMFNFECHNYYKNLYRIKIKKEKIENILKNNINFTKTIGNSYYFKRETKFDFKTNIKSSIYEKPKYPIYVISYKRYQFKKILTINHLNNMKVEHFLVIEKQEQKDYENMIKKNILNYSKLLIMEEKYCNLKQGSKTVRNYVLNHSKKYNHKKHWVLDDNINGFFRFNQNHLIRYEDGSFFTILEKLTDNFKNVFISGPEYSNYIQTVALNKPFVRITRVFSCILIDNKITDLLNNDNVWRLKYNEDVDLCLQVLQKQKSCLLFLPFVINKCSTGSTKGGNQNIYKNHTNEGYKLKYQCLKDQWQHINNLVKPKQLKRGLHHNVDYKHFTKHLKIELKENINKIDEKDFCYN
jgi:hypothetical protein